MAPCEFQRRPANPLRVSCVSKRSRRGAVQIKPLRVSCVLRHSRCGAVRILNADCESSRCFRWVPALAHGASCEFGLESTTVSLFFSRCGSAWSVLQILLAVDAVSRKLSRRASYLILFVLDDPLLVFGGRRRCRVERPQNSFIFVRNRQPSRGFRRVAALTRAAFSEFCS